MATDRCIIAPPAALSSASGRVPPQSSWDPSRPGSRPFEGWRCPRPLTANPTPSYRFFLASLKSAMIKGCREPPYPSILTDATMEKLALAKFVAQESKCEVEPGVQGRCCGVRGQATQKDVLRTSPSPTWEGLSYPRVLSPTPLGARLCFLSRHSWCWAAGEPGPDLTTLSAAPSPHAGHRCHRALLRACALGGPPG